MQAQDGIKLFGVRLLGASAESGRKLLLTVAVIVIAWVLSRIIRHTLTRALHKHRDVRAQFWSKQAVHLLLAALSIILLVSIWFDNPGRLTNVLGLLTAGLAVALSRVLVSIAAYFIILTSRVFTVGDRIVMGGVRGDVIELGYFRTTILEMGQPPPVQSDEPAMWVEARQYTGRLVTVTNDRIFDTPVYNFTDEFQFIWEEMKIGVGYHSDRARAEEILLSAAARHGTNVKEMAAEDLKELRRRYFLENASVEPRVFWRLTSNWLELAVRFVAPTSGTRDLKDRMTRDILRDLERAKIEIASTSFQIVGLPPVQVTASMTGAEGTSK